MSLNQKLVTDSVNKINKDGGLIFWDFGEKFYFLTFTELIASFLANALTLYPRENIRKITVFLVFSGGMKWEYWSEMG